MNGLKRKFIKRYQSHFKIFFSGKLKNKGNLSIPLLALFIVYFSYLSLGILTSKIELNKMIERKETYLCYKKQRVLLENFISINSKLNTALVASYYLQFNPVPAVVKAARSTNKSLKVAQQAYLYFYWAKLVGIKNCITLQTLSMIKTTPYKHNLAGIYERRFDSSLILKKKKWDAYIPSNIKPSGVSLHSLRFQPYIIKASFELKSRFSSNIKMSALELGPGSSINKLGFQF